MHVSGEKVVDPGEIENPSRLLPGIPEHRPIHIRAVDRQVETLADEKQGSRPMNF